MSERTPTRQSRILLFSQRGFRREFYMCGNYEFEDVIAEIDDVSLVTTEAPDSSLRRWRLWAENSARSAVGRHPNSGIPTVNIEGDYDFFFCILEFGYDAAMLEKLTNFRRRCRKAACFVIELWTSEVERYKSSLRLLRELGIDHIFSFNRSSLDALRQTTAIPCSYLPMAVDCFRFSPAPCFPPRHIDCYSMGRRSPVTHAALLRLSQNGRFFYMYDSATGQMISDFVQHRMLIANIIRRSRYFTAYKAGLDRPRSLLGGDESLMPRLFEAAAGGAIVLGIPPDCPEYQQCFNWPDSIIRIPYECDEIEDVLAALDLQPERIEEARRQNIVQSLRRHDWVYRWRTVLETLGMSPTRSMHLRERRLENLADATAAAACLDRSTALTSSGFRH